MCFRRRPNTALFSNGSWGTPYIWCAQSPVPWWVRRRDLTYPGDFQFLDRNLNCWDAGRTFRNTLLWSTKAEFFNNTMPDHTHPVSQVRKQKNLKESKFSFILRIVQALLFLTFICFDRWQHLSGKGAFLMFMSQNRVVQTFLLPNPKKLIEMVFNLQSDGMRLSDIMVYMFVCSM